MTARLVLVLALALALAGPALAEAPRQEIWYHTGYPGGVQGPGRGMSARMGPTKMPIVFQAIQRQRLVDPAQLHVDGGAGPAPPIDLASLRAVHTDHYLKALLTGEPRSLACSQGLSAWSPAIARGWLLNVGGLYAAAETALRKRSITANLGHGYHHATTDRGQGFCTINGLAVVASKLIREGKARRVMVIDLDQHEGNGTAECTLGDNRIWNVSLYGSPMGGPSGAANNHVVRVSHASINRGRGRDVNYLAVIASRLPELIRRQDPDLILYQAGMDPYDCAGISSDALAVRDAYVFSLARSMNKPVAWVLAGGYSDTGTLERLHTTTVKMANQVLAGVKPGDRIELGARDPYRWSRRPGHVTFPDWRSMAGQLRVETRPTLEEHGVQQLVGRRHRLLREQRLPDAEMRSAYRDLLRD